MKLEGISLTMHETGNFDYVIKADILIESINKLKNRRGFLDRIGVKLSKPSEKGVTHLLIANVPEDKVSSWQTADTNQGSI